MDINKIEKSGQLLYNSLEDYMINIDLNKNQFDISKLINDA